MAAGYPAACCGEVSFLILLNRNAQETTGITVYPNIPINRRFILFNGNAINPSNDSNPDKIMIVPVTFNSFSCLTDNPKRMKATPKNTSQASISVDKRKDGQSSESMDERSGFSSII